MLRLLRNKNTYETIIRYLLGLSMLPYGLTKIMRTQFIILPFYLWSEPLKNVSGTTLTWAFLGYSPWFTVLLGCLEIIPSILLLFRRTKLLGAILLFPVLLNVFLINMALDLWPNTQKISALLFIMNIVLISFHFKLIKELFKRILTNCVSAKKKVRVEVLVNILLIGLVIAFSFKELNVYISQRNFLTGDWYNKKPVYWEVKEIHKKHIASTTEDYVRYYFQPYQIAYILMSGNGQPIYKKYFLDEKNRTLSIYDDTNSSNLMKGPYKIVDKQTIEWSIESSERKLLFKRQELE